jgi:hypothetical protein
MIMINQVQILPEIVIYFFASIQIDCGSYSGHSTIGVGLYNL